MGENVLITKGGNVKISETGSSMMQGLADIFAAGVCETLLKKPKNGVFSKAKDVQAVRHTAWRLLRLEESTRVRGTVGLLAEDFAGALPTATADDLLQVRVIE